MNTPPICPKRAALDDVADYIIAKRTADAYPADEQTEHHLNALATKALKAFRTLTAE